MIDGTMQLQDFSFISALSPAATSDRYLLGSGRMNDGKLASQMGTAVSG
jgi:hypothetical protein